jgi:hypothetical protein
MFARIKDNQITEYPLTEWHIRQRINFFGSAPSFDVLLPYDYIHVQDGSRPSFDPETQELSETKPVIVDGKWTRNWVAVSKLNEQELSDYSDKLAQERVAAFERERQSRIDAANEIIARYNAGEVVYASISLQDWQAYAQALQGVQYNENDRLIEWPVDPAVFLL